MKFRGGYSIAGLFLVLVLAVSMLPLLRRTFARSFPEGFQAMGAALTGVDIRKGDCKGVNCEEGEFCMENVCRPVYPSITNSYFPTSTS